MSIEKAKEIYTDVLKAASSFISPSLKNYFENKANEDFKSIQSSSNSDILNYIEEQKKLKEQLGNVIGIYNKYRDNTTNL